VFEEVAAIPEGNIRTLLSGDVSSEGHFLCEAVPNELKIDSLLP
jgi:hypothetical protein